MALRVACALLLAHAAVRDTCTAGSIVKSRNPAYVGNNVATASGGTAEHDLTANEDRKQEDNEAGHSSKATVVSVNTNSLALKWAGQQSPHATTVLTELVSDSTGKPCWVADAGTSGAPAAQGSSASGNLRGSSDGIAAVGGGGGGDGILLMVAAAAGGLLVVGCSLAYAGTYCWSAMRNGSLDYDSDDTAKAGGFARKLSRQLTSNSVVSFTRSLSQNLSQGLSRKRRSTRTKVQKFTPDPMDEQERSGRGSTDQSEEHAAATKLQAAHRGRKGRQQIYEMHGAATKLQSAHRGKAARREVDEMHGAATKLQSAHRGKAARREVQDLKTRPSYAARLARIEDEQEAPGRFGGFGKRRTFRTTHSKDAVRD